MKRDTPNNRFPSHFRDFINELNKKKVQYLVIGGYAMGAYGHHRGTGDLDIFINATDANAENLISAAIDYGIPKEQVKKEMFLVPKMVGIGQPPLRIELLKVLDTLDFEYAYQRVELKEVDGLRIRVASVDDLILLKKAARRGRSKARDIEDLTFLEKLKSKMRS
ncbi:MAG: nucleotidyltransferase [Bacteroidota bacterium]